VTTITAVAESLGEARPADQAVRTISKHAERGRTLAVLFSVGIAEVAWCGVLGWAIWTFVL
jgi:hypothetical protein